MGIFKSKTIRLKTQTQGQNDQFVTLQMNQTYDFINILSLKLPVKNLYQQFSSDFGVIAGRVNAMGGVGIPNCKVGIFIPKDDTVINNKLSKLKTDIQKSKIKISELLYPFYTTKTTDSNGRRFNLLPSKSKNRGYNGFPYNILGIGSTPKTPLGTFPEKEHVLSDDNWLYVYDNYFYLTTTTNDAGDFMIYAPIGQHTLVMDCDVTDIGKFSTTPAVLSKTMGVSPSFFEQNGTKIKQTNDLDNAPNIIHQEVIINVKPLWVQDTDNPEFGITRQDFDLKTELKPSFTVFGATINQNKSSYYFDWIKFQFFMGLLRLKLLCINKEIDMNPEDLGFIGGAINCRDKELFDTGDLLSFRAESDNKLDGEFFIRLKFKFWVCKLACPGLFEKLPTILDFDLSEPFCRLFDIFIVGFRMKFTFNFNLTLPAILPHIMIRFATKRACVLEGGDFSLPPIGFFYLGRILDFYYGAFCDTKLPSSVEEFIVASNTGIKDNINDSELLSEAENVRVNIDVFSIKNKNIVDPLVDIEVIDSSTYISFIEDGKFILQIPTNKNKIITAEDGTLILSTDETKGVYSSFDGYITLSPIVSLNVSPPKNVNVITTKMKIPQNIDDLNDIYSTSYSFKLGEIYSIMQYIPNINVTNNCNYRTDAGSVCGDLADLTGHPYKILNPNELDMPKTEKDEIQFIQNLDGSNFNVFRDGWLKFTVYFVNIGYTKKYKNGYGGNYNKYVYCTYLTTEEKLTDNLNSIGGDKFNTVGFLNSQYIQSDFIQVDKKDFIYFIENSALGFSDKPNNDSGVNFYIPNGIYKNAPNYFYKGKNVDSLKNVSDKNLI